VGIGLGYVESVYAKIGENILIKSGSADISAVICEKPFYKKGTARK
jgi:glycine cleavage system aminomethyltransferase T